MYPKKKFSVISRFCLPSVLFLIFSGWVCCQTGLGPAPEDSEELYVGCILKTGETIQRVYALKSTINPAVQVPGDSLLLAGDARVFLSQAQNKVQLTPDYLIMKSEIFDFSRPMFSTRENPLIIEPETTCQLEILWRNKIIRALTTTPAKPQFNPIDSILIVHAGVDGIPEFFISWKSAYQTHLLEIEYPASWRIKYGMNGRVRMTNTVSGSNHSFSVPDCDSSGILQAKIYAFNADYENYRQAAQAIEVKKPFYKRFSNIEGAHGVFAAMASDSVQFEYRIAN
ncbi:hypothetical protein JW964_00200 [candidate division KSB1 bacterium]|nr:hypothetical protein [candidate division KSB1 bacterium]